MKSIAILGASGHAKVVAEIAQLCGYEKIVFFDDAKNHIEHWEVKGNTQHLIAQLSNFNAFFVAIGNSKDRTEKTAILKSNGIDVVSLIHPLSILSQYAKIGAGTVIMAGSVVNAFANIGDDCIINTNSTVEHDCILANGVHISPNVAIAGGVSIGNGSWIGIGSSIKQNITIGQNVVVGAGSVVVDNLPNNTTAFGVPAKINAAASSC